MLLTPSTVVHISLLLVLGCGFRVHVFELSGWASQISVQELHAMLPSGEMPARLKSWAEP